MTSNKRKQDEDETIPATNDQTKRTKSTLIDDPTVISIFKELQMKDEFINSGALLAWALQPTDPDFINIHDYLERGQEHGYGTSIISIIRIIAAASKLESGGKDISFNDNPETAGQHRAMLWHGTQKHNLASILENGLRLPTHHGQMFGPGIYFADRVSKSCGYCGGFGFGAYGGNNTDTGFLLLCDVVLGISYFANKASRFDKAPKTKAGVQTQSVVGQGRRIPDPNWNMKIDGTVWPMGPTINRSGHKGYLQFNEYIVYDTSQVLPKYLVKFKYTQAPVHSVLY